MEKLRAAWLLLQSPSYWRKLMGVPLKGSPLMIRWRLRILMAEKNITNQKLAELSGLHRVTISKLKTSDELKQISGDTLNRLCNALKCTPNDLIEFTPDPPPQDAA